MTPATAIASSSAAQQAAAAAAQTSTTGTSSLTNPDMFLQLIIAQIQNQDPLQPTDSTQFVTQLAQFSSLQQLSGIRHDTDTLAQSSQNSPTPPTSGASSPVNSQP